MKLAFRFRYEHDNGLFVRLLNRLHSESTMPLYLSREGAWHVLEAEGEQAELESLADTIATQIPLSLFLTEHRVEAVEEMIGSQEPLEDLSEVSDIPYCPACYQVIANRMPDSLECDVCGGVIDLEDDRYRWADGLADLFVSDGSVSIETVKRHSRLTRAGETQQIVICDPDAASKHFVMTPGELEALASVEKPMVRLKPKLQARAEYGLEHPFYDVRFADSKMMLLACDALQRKGVPFVGLDDSASDSLRTVSALERHFIVNAGRDLLPATFDTVSEHPAYCRAYAFCATGDAEGITVQSGMQTVVEGSIGLVPKPLQVDKGEVGFEPSHGALGSIVMEHGLEGKALFGLHLSTTTPSSAVSFHPRAGYTPMGRFDTALLQPCEVFAGIASMNESGARLIANYTEKFPALYEQALRVRFKDDVLPDPFGTWAAAAVILGMYEGNDAREAARRLEATALEFQGKSGPRIDYKVDNTSEGYRFDPLKCIRSAMSFKLAGVDEFLISFGFIDSLADFIADEAERADANIGIEGVCLSGDLFENRQLLARAVRAIEKNFPLYFNKRLGMDRCNIVAGALNLGR